MHNLPLYNHLPLTIKTLFKELPVILQKDLQTLGKFTFQSHKHQIISQVFQPVLGLCHNRLGTQRPKSRNDTSRIRLDFFYLFREHHSYFPPDMPSISPNSLGYCEQVLTALGLDEQSYHHLQPNIMEKFKDLICKYPEVFYLSGSPLNEIRGFEHFINTGNARPVYRLPYKKSPNEIKALRDEIERMLTLQIIQPDKSAWGASCILVRRPPEKRQTSSLNEITVSDSYPIP